MAAFTKYMLNRFEDDMVVHLRACFPDAVGNLSGVDLHLIIEDGIRRAESHGIVTEYDAQRFLELLMIYGNPFGTDERTSWIGDILQSRNLSGSEKMDRIEERCVFSAR
jgi:hypothetical protein